MPPEPPVLKQGSFYRILESGAELILEDRTRRGLEIRERAVDGKLGVGADMGMIHDTDGIGHRVAIRWFFPRSEFSLDQVASHAKEMEERYARLRDLTCPGEDR